MLPRIMVYMAEQSATQQQRQPHITANRTAAMMVSSASTKTKQSNVAIIINCER